MIRMGRKRENFEVLLATALAKPNQRCLVATQKTAEALRNFLEIIPDETKKTVTINLSNHKVHMKNGSTIEFKDYGDKEKLRGIEYDTYIFEEHINKE